MKKTRLFFLFIVVAILGSVSRASTPPSVLVGPVQNPANGHSYYLFTAGTWQDSEAMARQMGGHLATVNEKAENDWIVETFSNYGAVQRHLWIGLSNTQGGPFLWANGEMSEFRNFSPGEPNDTGGKEHTVEIKPSGEWNDLPNDPSPQAVFGVIEVAPLPPVVAGPILNEANAHVYYLLADSSWTAAEAQAKRLGGHLATVNDGAENAWISSTFFNYGGQSTALWIGLTDNGHVGQFTWVDGEPVVFTNWHSGEPNNLGTEHYALIQPNWNAEWNNLSDYWPADPYQPTKGVVEVPGNPGQPAPSTDDLWDVSRGTVITGQSKLYDSCPSGPFDARDIFGGHFSACTYEAPGDAIFADNMPDGFVHYVEWATPNPVTVRSINLWAAGEIDSRRDMASFRLLTKSSGSSTFDSMLFTFTPSHPYVFANGVYGLLVSSDIKPTTARQFRAEFVNFAVPSGQSGPRILELDGFGDFIGPTANMRISEAEVSWDSAPSLKYQVEFREDLPGSNWTALGSPVVGDGGVMRVTDKIAPGAAKRFYRVRATE